MHTSTAHTHWHTHHEMNSILCNRIALKRMKTIRLEDDPQILKKVFLCVSFSLSLGVWSGGVVGVWTFIVWIFTAKTGPDCLHFYFICCCSTCRQSSSPERPDSYCLYMHHAFSLTHSLNRLSHLRPSPLSPHPPPDLTTPLTACTRARMHTLGLGYWYAEWISRIFLMPYPRRHAPHNKQLTHLLPTPPPPSTPPFLQSQHVLFHTHIFILWTQGVFDTM